MTSTDPEPSRISGKSEHKLSQATAMSQILGSSRRLVRFVVLGLFRSAATLLIYGMMLVIKTIWASMTFRSPRTIWSISRLSLCS